MNMIAYLFRLAAAYLIETAKAPTARSIESGQLIGKENYCAKGLRLWILLLAKGIVEE